MHLSQRPMRLFGSQVPVGQLGGTEWKPRQQTACTATLQKYPMEVLLERFNRISIFDTQHKQMANGCMILKIELYIYIYILDHVWYGTESHYNMVWYNTILHRTQQSLI